MIKTTTSGLRQLIAPAALAAMIVTAAAAAPAVAADTGEALSVHVKYGDLDLTHTAGVKELYSRLLMASKRVCEPLSGRHLQTKDTHNACFDNAMSHAVIDVNQPALTAMYSDKMGNVHPQRLALLTR